MDRRRFNAHLSAAAVLATTSLPTLAQGGPVDGKDFRRVSPPAPVPGHGKIDVVEFFWYGCPACNALEPALEAWVARLPADVAFRRIPVTFSALHEGHAKLYYALEAMGQLEAMHKRVFAALHIQRRRLDKLEDMAAFAAEQGLDRKKFEEAFAAFGVATKLRQGTQLAKAYAIEGVPCLGISGRFLTAGSMAGSNERALQVADQLIAQSRKPA